MRIKYILISVAFILLLGIGLTACNAKAKAPATQVPAAKPTNTQPAAIQLTDTQLPAVQPTDTQPPAVQPTYTPPPVVKPTDTQLPANTATVPLGGSDGATLLNQRYTVCHSLGRVTSHRFSADQWNQIVSIMVQNGAKLTSDEQKVLVAYLAQTYGP